MTRETKIGLLLGMCVILLIGIIISDQLSQPQQDPADFTDFAAETQRSIDSSDVAPGFTGAATPGIGAGSTESPTAPTGGPSPVIEPPSDFYIPSDRLRSPHTNRQADAATADASDSLLLNNVEDNSGNYTEPVTTVTIGQDDTELPHEAPVVYDLPEVRTPPTRANGSAIRHTVLKGETLTRIAERHYGNGDYWRTIAQANPGKVTPDGRVQLGVVLDIPKREDAQLGPAFVDAGSERAIRVDTRVPNTSGKTIEVKSGDTLSELAAKHLGSAGKWQELLDANKDKLDDPTGLQVGMKLRLPGVSRGTQASVASTGSSSSSKSKTYTVRPGDNLTQIAERTLGDGDKWRLIFKANKLKSPDRLEVGQELIIPG